MIPQKLDSWFGVQYVLKKNYKTGQGGEKKIAGPTNKTKQIKTINHKLIYGQQF